MSLPAADPLPLDLQPARAAATRHVTSGDLPCVVFGVADGAGRHEVVAVSGSRAPVRDDSVFFIASVTKAIVATAVMQYVDEGRLDLRVPLCTYLPELPRDGPGDVSAWHLLTHTSGLPDMPIERIRAERPDYQQMLAGTIASTTRWEPGTRYEYNSSAWVLLSELMARLSNTPFPGVLMRRLSAPLGMADTVFDARPLRRRIVAVNGVGADNRLVSEVLLWFLARATFPGGGMFSTAPDLLRLGRALLPSTDPATASRVLSRATVSAMAEQQIEGVPAYATDGSVTYVEQGLGWRKPEAEWPAGHGIITHGGKSGARLWVDLERDLAFVFLTNLWDAPSDAAVEVLQAIYQARG
jgi:CubicO group peptidase (beta-lactamase class C family)